MLVVLARLGSAEMVGRFGYGLAVTAPIVLFCNLQLRSVQATDARGQFRFADYLRLRLLTNGVALAAIATLAPLVGGDAATARAILLLGLAKVIEATSDAYYGLQQRNGRMDRIARSLLLRGPLGLGGLLVGVVLTGSVVWGVAGMALGWLVVLVAHDVPASHGTRRETAPAIGPPPERAGPAAPRLVRLARLALPLGLAAVITSLTANVPAYFIEFRHGMREVGLFTSLAYLLVVGSYVLSSLGQAALPRLADFHAARERRSFLVLLGGLLAFAALVSGAAVLAAMGFGERLLAGLYGPAFAREGEAFVALTAAWSSLYLFWFLGVALAAVRRFRALLLVRLAAAVAVVAGCALWVPGAPLIGAARAIALSGGVQIALSCLVLATAVARRNGSDRTEHAGT